MVNEYFYYVDRSKAVAAFLDKNLKPFVLGAGRAGLFKENNFAKRVTDDGALFMKESFVIDTPGEDLVAGYLEANVNAGSIVNWNYLALMTVVVFTGEQGEHLSMLSSCSNPVNADTRLRPTSDITSEDQLVGYYAKGRLVEAVLTDVTHRDRSKYKHTHQPVRYEVLTLSEARELLRSYNPRGRQNDYGFNTDRWLIPV